MEIVWSRLGERLFKSVLEYVGDNFGENVARQTFHRITEKVEQLKYFPGIGVKDFELAESLGFGIGVEVRHLVLPRNENIFSLAQWKVYVRVSAGPKRMLQRRV